jgi:predicted nucleotidyltransferase
MTLPPDFRELLEEFDREGVSYVIIGGYAYAFHAEPRATKDLDLFIEGSEANRARVSRALTRFGAPANVVAAARAQGETEVVYLGEAPLRVDILRTVDGVGWAQVLANSVRGTWDGMTIRVIGLDDLISNKRAAGRPRDLADVERLERVRSKKSKK